MDTEVRRLRSEEVERMVEELWLPFGREMAEIDEYNEFVDEAVARRHGVTYRLEQLEEDATRIWVAERDDWVGYVCATVSEAPPVFARGATLNVDELYVVPEARGEDVADALMDRAAEWGDDQDCERVGLSVNARNDRARAYYDSRGFEPRRLKMDRPL